VTILWYKTDQNNLIFKKNTVHLRHEI